MRFHPVATYLFFCAGLGLGLAMAAERGAEPKPIVIPFDLTKVGNVSAAIYDAKGHLVRELLQGVAKAPGKHFMVWDGLDRDGNSLPAGDYTWKLLQTPGLKARYVMSVGSNFPPGTDWSTACGPGTHVSPFGIAVDKTGIYVSAHTTENIETCMLKMTPDGKTRLWSALHARAWDGALSLAVDGGEVFMLGHVRTEDARVEPEKRRKQLVYVFDAATGKLAQRTISGTNVGNLPIKLDVQWDQAVNDMDATDMDAHGGVLVVAYEKRNALRLYDPKTGELLDTAEVAAPQGVTVGAGGMVYVATGDRVVKLSRTSKKPIEVARGLGKPGRLDVDRSSGELLVFVAGTQQIQRFAADGKLLSTYGEKGGRKEGLHDAKAQRSFAGFADLCADGAGGFYVTESTTAPRRTAHFARDGSVLREWYGGQRWAPHAATEGDNPNVLWVGSHYGWIMRVLVDYEKKSWTVHSCYKYTGLGDGLVGDSHNEGCYFRVYKHDGHTYLALERLPTILKVDEAKWKLLPVTVCGAVANAPQSVKDWAGKNQSFQWNDTNGDGLPQRDEVTFYADGIANSYEPYIAPDFSCFTVSHGKEARQVHKFVVSHWNKAGAPVYGTMPNGELFGVCPRRFDTSHFADSRWSAFLHQDPRSGQLFAALNDWTRDWCDYNDSFMHQWSAAGESRWTVGQRSAGPVVPGEVHTHLRGVAGLAHGCVVAIDVNGGWYGKNPALTYVWDQDGLFVGGLMDAPDLNGIEKHWYQCGGEFCHASVHTLPSGDVLFYGNWENEMRVYRISGWDGWSRQSSTFRLDQPRAARTGQGLAVNYYDDAALTRLRGVGVDAKIDLAWPADKPVAAGIRWTGTILPEYGPAYTGPWRVSRDKEYFDGTIHGSRDDGASVTFRFRGSSINVVGVTGPNFGFADIVLDGKPQPRVDCYSAKVARHVSLFARTGLAGGDHEVMVTVVGWFGKPRNKASTDAWVMLDKFVVDGQECDDTGLLYTFSANADGKLSLWIDRDPVFRDEVSSSARTDRKEKAVRLTRKHHTIQLDYERGSGAGGVTLLWSNPFEPKQPIPTRNLYPVIAGGHIVQSGQSRP